METIPQKETAANSAHQVTESSPHVETITPCVNNVIHKSPSLQTLATNQVVNSVDVVKEMNTSNNLVTVHKTPFANVEETTSVMLMERAVSVICVPRVTVYWWLVLQLWILSVADVLMGPFPWRPALRQFVNRALCVPKEVQCCSNVQRFQTQCVQVIGVN